MAKVATIFFMNDHHECCQVYHSTTVTRVGMDDAGLYVVLDSGGWLTQTTKKRMNDVLNPLGWTVYQEDWSWFVSPHADWSVKETFHNGMVIRPETVKLEVINE